MKVLVLFSVLFVTIFILLQHVSSISSLDKETYELFVQLIKGEFTVPVKSRTIQQKSALVRFWRNREKLSLRRGILCYDGKSVAKKEAVSDVVKKMYKSSKGSGVRKIYHKLKNSYSGVAERDVQKVLAKSSVHQRLNVRFENKARLRPVRAKTVQIRHQIDLVDMKRLRTKYKGKTYKYVLSIIDVFSRYHWLVPLQTKKSSHLACELLRIYTEHGAPRVIQHDQGREFEGAVAALCKKLSIKVVKGRPYHPQSQGKVERAHRSFKKKIMHDFLVMGKAGVNWIQSLPDFARSLNLDPKEELSWKSPFEIYYGRKPNVVSTGNPHVEEWDMTSKKYHSMIHPRSKDYSEHETNLRAIRNLASSATRKCAQRMVAHGERKNPPSVYEVGETVLIRYPSTKKSVSKRHVLKANIVDRKVPKHQYKVKFVSLTTGKLIEKWISVSDITSLTIEREKRKRKAATKCMREEKKKKAHRKKYFHSYENQRSLFEDRTGSAHFAISFDPPKDGNCQFAAICKLLNSIGIHRSNHTMRDDIVKYLNNNPIAADGTPLQNFTDLPWPTYLSSMSQNGTFGDHITLQAASNLFNVAFLVLSSNGPGYETTVSPVAANPICTFILGHFAEDDGEHYVCLTDESDFNELDNVAECLANVGYSAPCRGESSSENGENPLNGVDVCVDNQSSGDDDQVSASRQNTLYDDQRSVGTIRSADGDQASVGGQDSGNRDETCQNRSSTEPCLNPDILEEIVRQTLRLYPYMRSSLRAVSRFFRNIVEREPLPQVYIPELNDVTDIRHVSVRKIILLKGKNSGAVLRLKEIINSVLWARAWLSFFALGHGWFSISNIYWKRKSHR